MAVVAEPALDLIDDRLAARNAVILAVAQALAGGNNTVIVATTGIIGSMLAPDPALATLPISVMVAGMWMGTLPVGMLAKAYGRRFALADRLGLRRAVRPDLVRGGAARLVLAVAGRHFVRRPLRGGASILSLRRHRYGEPAVSAQGRRLGAGRRHLRRRDRLAARHLHQGRVAALSVRRHVPGAVGLRGARRDRAGAAQNSAPAGVAFADRRAAAQRQSSCSRNSSSPSSAASPAIR